MDNRGSGGYNFSQILTLSVADSLADLPKEWECVNFRSGPSTQCVCSRWIKHAYHFINRLNGNTIRAGTGCVKKLSLKENGEGNTTNRFILSFITQHPGEYTNIYDLLRYSEQSRKDMLDTIESTLLSAEMSEKRILLPRVREIYDIFIRTRIDSTRIQAIYERLDLEIRMDDAYLEKRKREAENWIRRAMEEIEKRREEEEKRREEEEKRREEEEKRKVREAERRQEENRIRQVMLAEEAAKKEERANEKREALQRERERQEILRREEQEQARIATEAEAIFIREQLEKKLKAKELCACGLTMGEICRCEIPKFEVYRLNKQYVCIRCSKWKDRCP